jgi:hypothetical protein
VNTSPTHNVHWRGVGGFAAVLAAITFTLVAYPSLRASWYGASSFQDDTFYYLVTAKNFLRLGVFTFDGSNSTNGFQPLWMVAVVTLFKLVGPDSALELQIFAVNILEKVLLGATVAASIGFYVYSSRRNLPWATGYLGLLLVLLCPFYFVFDQGMETTLAVLLLLIVIYAFLSDSFPLLGLALALLFLTRLDTAVFVATPLVLWMLLKARQTGKHCWLGIAIFLVTFCSYVALNLAATGHAVPISGALKSSFPHVRWQGAFFTEPINLARMFGWMSLLRGINIVECAGLVLLGLVLTALARPAGEIRNKLLLLATIATLLLANLLMFQKWDKSIDPRYLALPMSVASIFVANAFASATGRAASWLEARAAPATRATAKAGTDGLSKHTPAIVSALRAMPVAVICVLLLGEAGARLSRVHADADRHEDPIRRIFLEVSRVLPPDAVVAGTDVGALSFWTQRKVINLDGVINNFEYQEYLRAGRLRDYLRERGVTYLATALWDREQTYTGRPIEPMYRQVLDPAAERGVDYVKHEFFVYSYLYGVYSDAVTLGPRDEVYRIFLGKNGVADTTYVVYRFPG